MKRIYLLFAALCVTCVLAAQDVKELLILHTNDTHSRVEPIPENDPNPEFSGKAGFVRRATLLKELRKENKDLLLFDCGDFSQGSPFYNMFKGEVEVKLMNEMGYNAGTIGNHEFDFGLDNMARLFKLADFPIVCSNYGVKGTVLEDCVKDYIILNHDGLKIGVFGLSPVLEGLVQAKNCEGIVFKNPIEEAQRVATFLKEKEKCDLVICLSHLGWKGEPYSDETLIPNTRDIDIVLGGHSHSYFDEPKFYKNLDGVDVPLQQMGKNAAYVGKMRVKMQKN
ncbi:bifunctional metallophosphatase/5'-nucleotidase [Phocaeicola sp.]